MADRKFEVEVSTVPGSSAGVDKTRADLANLKQQGGATPVAVGASPAGGAAAAETGAAAGALGTLIGTFGGIGILALISTVAGKISDWAENLKKTAEEQRGLNREIDKAVRDYEKIRSPEQWDRENEKIEENIQKLRDKRAITTDSAQIEALNQEIAAYERQQVDLAILAQRGLDRAQAEEKVKLAIKDQINALADQDRNSQRVQTAAENRAKTENQLTDLRAKGKEAAIDLARERGLITETQAIQAKAKIEREAQDENFKRSQNLSDQKIRSAQDEVARTKFQREEAQKGFDQARSSQAADLKARSDAARISQEAKDAETKAADARKAAERAEDETIGGFGAGGEKVKAAKEAADAAQKEATEKRRAADNADAYVRNLDKGKDALDEELKRTKSVLENRQQAEEAAKRKAADVIPATEQEKKAASDIYKLRKANQDEELARNLENTAAHSDAQGEAIVRNRAAAEKARAEGNQRDAELFERSAREFERSPSTQPQTRSALAEADRLRAEAENLRRGVPGADKAQSGVSDHGVSEIVSAINRMVDLWR